MGPPPGPGGPGGPGGFGGPGGPGFGPPPGPGFGFYGPPPPPIFYPPPPPAYGPPPPPWNPFWYCYCCFAPPPPPPERQPPIVVVRQSTNSSSSNASANPAYETAKPVRKTAPAAVKEIRAKELLPGQPEVRYYLTIPGDVQPDEELQVDLGGQEMTIVIPPNVKPGEKVIVVGRAPQ